MHIGLKIFIWGVLGLVVFGALLFGPAGTFDYWQAWVFLAAFVSTTIGPTIYLARNDPAALQRRMRSGPLAEGRTIQKFIVIGAFLGFFAMMVLSACDHRYGWSSVPAAVCVIGDVLVMTGLGIAMLVVIQNRYAASTVRVEAGQILASDGLYKIVRHPMYAGNVVMMTGFWPRAGAGSRRRQAADHRHRSAGRRRHRTRRRGAYPRRNAAADQRLS